MVCEEKYLLKIFDLVMFLWYYILTRSGASRLMKAEEKNYKIFLDKCKLEWYNNYRK